MPNSFWLHGLHYARLSCPSLSPEVCSDSHPLSQWFYPTISSSVIPFYSCPQSFQVLFHQVLFQWVNTSYQVAKVLELQVQYQSFLRISSVQFSRSVVFDYLRPHELQHIRPPCPSPTPGVHSDSCPSSQWCHPAISSSVVPFSSCPQSLPASESFPMSQLFAWGDQSTGVLALASLLPKKSQGWSPSEWTG